jgi:hypothetical protein
MTNKVYWCILFLDFHSQICEQFLSTSIANKASPRASAREIGIGSVSGILDAGGSQLK